MTSRSGYALLDAGGFRRLERFGDRLVERPAPVAAEPRRDPGAWAAADLRFDRAGGWRGSEDAVRPWTIELAGLTLELRPTPAGQLGLFPEHVETWTWLADRVRERASGGEAPRVLNLFAYTGGTTLTAASAGASLAHVDASRPSVAWARRNAQLSGLADRPIRWLVDDAETFVRREARRGATHDGLVLDPPSYGHGGRRGWRLDERLPDLLAACAAILDPRRPFVLLTAHTPGVGPDRLAHLLAAAVAARPGDVEAGPFEITAESGARLPLGAFARWSVGT